MKDKITENNKSTLNMLILIFIVLQVMASILFFCTKDGFKTVVLLELIDAILYWVVLLKIIL